MTVRQPPAGKGYDLQREYTADAEPFWFRWEDQWWTLPHGKMLDFEKLLRVAQLEDSFAQLEDADVDGVMAKLNETFAMLMGEEQAADFAQVNRPLPALLQTFKQWREHSSEGEQEAGESSASNDSSTSTGRPSKRTSNASTASASRGRSTAKPRKSATPRGNSTSGSAG